MNINDFSFLLGIESINLFKLQRYIKESNIVHELWIEYGFGADHSLATKEWFGKRNSYVWRRTKMITCSGLMQVVKEARAVVLTLQPVSQLYDCLFPHLPPEKVCMLVPCSSSAGSIVLPIHLL
ncbi:hypothetical protein BDL97_16G012000 [Sphagnum fallax]|nr:hypothetical protein BDL97_16G012000 [Sphagnum fallax]